MGRLARVEARGKERQRAPGIATPQDRDARRHVDRRAGRCENGRRSALRRFAGKPGAVGMDAGHRGKEKAGTHGPAVGGEASDLDGGGPRGDRQVGGGEVSETHSLEAVMNHGLDLT
jgi:hypothetical protein